LGIIKQNKIKNFEKLPGCPDFFCEDCSLKDLCNNNLSPEKEETAEI
jgi:hypothetical protein